MRRILTAVLGAMAVVWIVIGLLVIFASGPGGAPVYADSPTFPPAMHLVSGPPSSSTTCARKSSALIMNTRLSLVWVNPDPESVTAVWVPGEDSTACKSVISHGDRSLATSLAAALDGEPSVDDRTYMCPNDNGSEVSLYFSYGRDQKSELAAVRLEGCPVITDSGRQARWWSMELHTSKAFGAALASMAPAYWRLEIDERLAPTISQLPDFPPASR